MGTISFATIIEAWRKISPKTKLIVIASIAVLFTFLFPIVCNLTGGVLGGTVGTAVGSFKAITEDMPKAYADSKTDGLSAEDTTVIVNQIKETGRLDVLAATAKILDVQKEGDKYAALREMGADIIFTIDLSQAQLLFGDNMMEIILPLPEATISFDSTKTRLIAEWQRWFANGSTKEGMDGYLNSLRKLELRTGEGIANYEYLNNRAKESARQQVSDIAGMLVQPGTSITVRFEETEGKSNE